MNIEKIPIVRQLLVIRGCLFALQIITTTLIPPYDTSALEARYKPGNSNLYLDWLGNFGHANWDAVYFNYLAEHGYDYERFGAFFPLYPWVLSVLSSMLYLPLQFVLSYYTCIVLTSFLLNNFIFILNSFLIYKLSKLFGLTDVQAYRSSILYAVNPANIFMSVGYTESLFSFFVLLGLIIREADSQWYFVFFSLATGVRSNGMTLCGFILYDHITFMIKSKQILIVNIVCMVIQICVSIAPFFWFQEQLYNMYCTDESLASEWCDLGISYGYIQAEYWGVGLFKYWEAKQIPNFVLASPMFLLVLIILLSWLYDHYRSNTFSQLHNTLAIFSFQTAGYLHILALSCIVLVSMHVQVGTRFLVANCPYLFVYCAKMNNSFLRRVIFIYFVVYSVAGTIVHTTFYPWT